MRQGPAQTYENAAYRGTGWGATRTNSFFIFYSSLWLDQKRKMFTFFITSPLGCLPSLLSMYIILIVADFLTYYLVGCHKFAFDMLYQKVFPDTPKETKEKSRETLVNKENKVSFFNV